MKKIEEVEKKIISFSNRLVRRQLMITLLSLLICGLLFLLFMIYKLNQPLSNDIYYYLKTTNNEINAKTKIISDAVIRLRNNDIVTDYLNGAAIKATPQQEMNQIFQEFFHDTGIHSENNLAESGNPFMDAVFLFDNSGNNLGAHYDSMQSQIIDKKAQKFQSLHHDFSEMERENNLRSLFISDEENIYICQSFHNNNFDPVGLIIFSINKKSLLSIINRGNNYPNIIWYLTDENGQKLQHGSNDQFSQTELHDVVNKADAHENSELLDRYLYDIKGISMNMYSIIALSKSHTRRLLLSNIWVYLILILVIAVSCAFFMLWFVKKQIKPLGTITSQLTRVQKGDFDTKMPQYDIREFQEISDSFNSMTDQISYLIQEVYEKQILITKSELKFTQAQMNPHFMFNVLNTIALHARINNDDEVNKMLSSFSGLLQATLFKSNQEKETVRGELTYVEYYLSLQHLRYVERLNYKLVIEDDSLLDLYIPKLCIQTVVENAVVHGMEPKAEKSMIIVNVYAVERDLIIDVIDNGVGFKKADGMVTLPLQVDESSEKHNRIGLSNVNKIIKIMYGARYGVSIYSKENEGAIVTICVPFDQNKNREV